MLRGLPTASLQVSVRTTLKRTYNCGEFVKLRFALKVSRGGRLVRLRSVHGCADLKWFRGQIKVVRTVGGAVNATRDIFFILESRQKFGLSKLGLVVGDHEGF